MRASLGICTILIGLTGCRCGPTELAPEPAKSAHYAEWDALVTAVAEGRRADAASLARAVTDPDDDGPETARVRAGLGFVQVAADRAELADGLVSAATACGGCHGQAIVMPPGPPPTAAPQRAVDSLVWNRTFLPSASDPEWVRAACDAPLPAPDSGGGPPESARRVMRLLEGPPGEQGG